MSSSVGQKYAVIGASNQNASGVPHAGSAYVFNVTSGALVSTLTSPSPQSNGLFGFSVSVDGTYAMVGAPYETSNGVSFTGNAYIYNVASGTLVSTLTSPSPEGEGEFGFSVSLSGAYALVGAPYETSNNQSSAGNAYVFNVSSGALISTLVTPNPQYSGSFGCSVSLSGAYALVGARLETSHGAVEAGNAYVFNAKSGSLISTLTSPRSQAYGQFGFSVSLSGRMALVGAPYETSARQVYAGNAYLFNVTSGVLLAHLSSPTPETNGNFGRSLFANGLHLLVGAPYETAGGQYAAGNAYVFNAKDGKLVIKLSNPAPQFGADFGSSVSVSGKNLVVGAPFETPGGLLYAGTAYVYNANVLVLTLSD